MADELTPDELDSEQGEELPDREAMTTLPIGDPFFDLGIPAAPPPEEGELTY
jgi:hypothetical protein